MKSSQMNDGDTPLFTDFVIWPHQEKRFDLSWLESEESNLKFFIERLETFSEAAEVTEYREGKEFEGKSHLERKFLITNNLSDEEKKVYLFSKSHSNFMSSKDLSKTLEVFDPHLNNIPYITTEHFLDKRFDYDPNAAQKRPMRKRPETNSEFYLHNPQSREPLIKFSPNTTLPKVILNATDDILNRLEQRDDYRNNNNMKKEYPWGFDPFNEQKRFFGNMDYMKDLHVAVVKKNLKCLKHKGNPVEAICLFRGCRIGRLCCALCSHNHSTHLKSLLIIDYQHSLAPETVAVKLGVRKELSKIIRSVELDWKEIKKRLIEDVENFYKIWCYDKISNKRDELFTVYDVKRNIC
jgi:hypothetical protein